MASASVSISAAVSHLLFAVPQWLQLLFLQLFLIYFLLSYNGFNFCFCFCSCFSSFYSVLQWLKVLVYFCCCFSSFFCCPAMSSAFISVSAAVSHLFFAVLQWLPPLFRFLQLFLIYFLLSCNGFRFYFCFCNCFPSNFCCPAMVSASVSIYVAVSHLSFAILQWLPLLFLFMQLFLTYLLLFCNGFRFYLCFCSCFLPIFCCSAMASAFIYVSAAVSYLSFAVLQWLPPLFMFLQLFLIYFLLSCNGFRFFMFLQLFPIYFLLSCNDFCFFFCNYSKLFLFCLANVYSLCFLGQHKHFLQRCWARNVSCKSSVS